MSQLPKPFVSLFINGVDVGSELAPYLLDFQWTDNLHGKADEISGKLRDDQGLWRGAWRPAQEETSKTYSSAKVSYLDPDRKELIKGEVQDLSAKSGDVLKIDERVENEEQAQKLAKGRLAKANENKRTANLSFVGDPLLMAGQVIELGVTFGKYAGRYLTHCARHKIARASYTTQLELKGVE